MELYQPTLICLENYLFLEFRWKVFTKLVQLNLRFSWKFLLEYHFKYRRTIPYQIIQGMTPLPLKNFFIFAPFVGIIEIWKLWKFQLLTPSGFWDIAIWKFGKIPYGDKNHFEFTLSLIISDLKNLSSWNLVQVSFLAWDVQKSHLEYTKTN